MWSRSGRLLGMGDGDARSLSAEAKEALRIRAVRAVASKQMTQQQAADAFGVKRPTVGRWMSEYKRGGEQALAARALGRPPGPRVLTGWQASWVKRAVVGRCPDQLKLPGLLWTRDLVRELIIREFGITVSVETVGRYLKRWGLTVQKPSRQAFEQSAPAVAAWLKVHYPKIRADAAAEGAEILWGDEAGVRSDHQTGTSWGLKGVTPVVRTSGKRFSVNVISTVTNEGALRFMVFEGSFTQQIFITFMRRLIKNAKRRIYLIVDNHVVHRGKIVRTWLDKHAEQIRVIRLPSYSPELNPDELLNQDLKQHVGRARNATAADMTRDVRGLLRERQNQPETVKGYFTQPTTAYAA